MTARSAPSKARGADEVTAALQHYATRGVFRGFSTHPGRQGRVEYRFVWLMRRPMVVTFDPVRSELAFKDVLPRIAAMTDVASAVKAVVSGRTSRTLPAHKRLDGRKANVRATVRSGDLSVRLVIRGAQHGYAVRMGLNLINELFVLLHETYPDYLMEHFGLPAE